MVTLTLQHIHLVRKSTLLFSLSPGMGAVHIHDHTVFTSDCLTSDSLS